MTESCDGTKPDCPLKGQKMPYCFKCKKHQEVDDLKTVKTSNGRTRVSGNCSVCKSKVSSFTKKKSE